MQTATTYYYHIITSEPRVQDWLTSNGIEETPADGFATGLATAGSDAAITIEEGGAEGSNDGPAGSPERQERARNPGQVDVGEHELELQQQLGALRSSLRASPWKVVCVHSGGVCTRRKHWHLLYISRSKQWGHNSYFGRIIRAGQHKCSGITCLTCIYQYLDSGNGRQILKDDLSRLDFENCKCAFHSIKGTGPNAPKRSDFQGAERGNRTSQVQSVQQGVGAGGLDSSSLQTYDDVPAVGRRGMEHQQGDDEIGAEQTPGTRRPRSANSGRDNAGNYFTNTRLVLLFCEKRAFNEGDGERVLSKTPEGIEFLFKQRANERIKTALSVARLLVFQETLIQRIERCKKLQIAEDPYSSDPVEVELKTQQLIDLLTLNDIETMEFARDTFMHMSRQTGKKNNLFFHGPPSTGKTMIMESLVNLHYNFARLTGLTANSSFNFSSLLNVNACFMDECRLTDNQFEQWKLLAAGSPMATDVKYKERHNVTNCVLYTCANHNIGQYIQLSDAHKAIEARTIQYNFVKILNTYTWFSVFVWESLWRRYGFHL